MFSRKWQIVFFVAVVINVTQVFAVNGRSAIKFRADSWCPYNCEPKSDSEGYAVEVLRSVYGPSWQVDYEVYNWKRAIDEAKKGTINGVIGAARRDGEGLIFPEEEIGISQNCLYKVAGSPLVFDGKLSNIKKKSIGAVAGYSYGPYFDDLIDQKKIRVIEEVGQEPLQKNITKLIARQLDYVLEDEAVMTYNIRKGGFEKLILSAGCDNAPEKLYVAFSNRIPASKDFANTFDQRIRVLRESGELAKILKKYGLNDWKTSSLNLKNR